MKYSDLPIYILLCLILFYLTDQVAWLAVLAGVVVIYLVIYTSNIEGLIKRRRRKQP